MVCGGSALLAANILNLPAGWLPIGPADLFRMGLPEGCAQRLVKRAYGPSLTVSFISCVDQIHFKRHASVNRGGYEYAASKNSDQTC